MTQWASSAAWSTFTPYAMWRRQHAGHHANWNNLDRRVSGVDIYSNCLTVAEYRRLSSCRRLVHRVVLHPIVSLLLLPPLVFLVLYRLAFDAPAGWEHERWAVQYTNLALLVLYGSLGFVFGFVSVLYGRSADDDPRLDHRRLAVLAAPLRGCALVHGATNGVSPVHRYRAAPTCGCLSRCSG